MTKGGKSVKKMEVEKENTVLHIGRWNGRLRRSELSEIKRRLLERSTNRRKRGA